MNIKKNITIAVIAGAVAFGAFAGPVAANDQRNSGNSGSDNTISFRSERNVSIDQRNDADIKNDVSIYSNTGGNRSDDNWRGDSDITSGDSNANVRIGNFANLNYARVGGNFDSRFDFNDLKNRDFDKDKYTSERDKDMKDDHDKKDGRDFDKDYGDNRDNKKDNHNDEGDKNDGHDLSKDRDNKDKDKDKDRDLSKDNNADHRHDFSASLSGGQVVPGPGDPDATGNFTAKADQENGTLCVELRVSNIEPAEGAHIHYGEKGVAGPALVALPTPDANGYASGCVTLDSDTLWKLTENPWQYYVQVHNGAYPDGADRGQLY